MNIMIHLIDGKELVVSNVHKIVRFNDENNSKVILPSDLNLQHFEFLPSLGHCFYGDISTIYVLTEKISYLEITN
uniref:Uncharacterized protein n=1 Tax=Siphoviridae sp. ctLnP14 TaxID=2827851 RepID=A0A8S5S8U2_9CAUD|nr:MAG TPA: hypothetical protein [Siphoviridae sp. ctLnP14]